MYGQYVPRTDLMRGSSKYSSSTSFSGRSACRKSTGSMSSAGVLRRAATYQTTTSMTSAKNRSTRARLPGKASSSASTASAQSAGRVTSYRPATTARYRSCSWTNSSESATPSPSNSERSVSCRPSVPTPDSWCSAVSNSKRPRRKEVAQPPGTLWRSTRRVRSPARCKVVAAVSPALPAPMTTASKSVVTVTARRPLARSARTGRPWPRPAPGRRRAGAPSP